MLWIIKKIKTWKQKTAYYQSLVRRQDLIFKAFCEMENCRGLEWILQDTDILDKLYIRAITHDDDLFEKEYFNTFRKTLFPINQEEKNNNVADFMTATYKYRNTHDYCWECRALYPKKFTTNTELACLEEIIDWLADSYKTGIRPFQKYEELKPKMIENGIPRKELEFLEKCIYQGIDKIYILAKEGKLDVWDIL